MHVLRAPQFYYTPATLSLHFNARHRPRTGACARAQVRGVGARTVRACVARERGWCVVRALRACPCVHTVVYLVGECVCVRACLHSGACACVCSPCLRPLSLVCLACASLLRVRARFTLVLSLWYGSQCGLSLASLGARYSRARASHVRSSLSAILFKLRRTVVPMLVCSWFNGSTF